MDQKSVPTGATSSKSGAITALSVAAVAATAAVAVGGITVLHDAIYPTTKTSGNMVKVGGIWYDLQSDRMNCGAAGVACAKGFVCSSGLCINQRMQYGRLQQIGPNGHWYQVEGQNDRHVLDFWKAQKWTAMDPATA